MLSLERTIDPSQRESTLSRGWVKSKVRPQDARYTYRVERPEGEYERGDLVSEVELALLRLRGVRVVIRKEVRIVWPDTI